MCNKKENVSVKKTIAVIGTSSKRVSTIAKSLMAEHYRVLLLVDGDSNLATLAEFVNSNPGSDAELINCLIDASWEADIIVIALDADKELEVAASIKEVASCKLVISLAFNQAASGCLSSLFVQETTERLQQALPHSRVIKVFNSKIESGVDDTLLIDGKQISQFLEDSEVNYSDGHLHPLHN